MEVFETLRNSVLVTKLSLSYMESVYSRFQRENREGRDREEGLSAPRKDAVSVISGYRQVEVTRMTV
jgi:hypothetical protein